MRWVLTALLLAGCHAQTRGESLTSSELDGILSASRQRVRPNGPNDLHMQRLVSYAPPFAKAAGAELAVVQAAALLHDATKEDGAGEPKERFCNHGAEAGAWAVTVLRGLGRSESFATRVGEAVTEHMGPCGQNEEWNAPRFMTKFCAREYPKPSSPEAKVLFDLDMLDLMTVEGVVKVVQLRQRGAEFEREPIIDSAVKGADSAWKSVNDAQQTLITPMAQACGAELAVHTKKFLDSIEWANVKSVENLKAVADGWLAVYPRPACLPR